MQDMQTHLETLRAEAAECEKIAQLATDEAKRELFAKLARHYRVLALVLQLPFPQVSESMGNHDSKIVDAASVD